MKIVSPDLLALQRLGHWGKTSPAHQPGTALPCEGNHKHPVQTKAAFTEDGGLRTDNKGVVVTQGNRHDTGHVKDLFKTSKVKYVGPAPIKDELAVHEAVEAWGKR